MTWSGSPPPSVFLTLEAWKLPFLLIYVVGLALALITWRRRPHSLFSLAAFALLCLGELLKFALDWTMFGPTAGGLIEADRYEKLRQAYVIPAVLDLGAWVLILLALFARRSRPPAPWSPDAPRLSTYSDVPSVPPTTPPSRDIRK